MELFHLLGMKSLLLVWAFYDLSKGNNLSIFFFVGNTYDLSGAGDLPDLSITVWHRGTLGVADVPLGEIVVGLDTVDPSGGPTEQWYPLQLSGARMKTVTGDVSPTFFFPRSFIYTIYFVN